MASVDFNLKSVRSPTGGQASTNVAKRTLMILLCFVSGWLLAFVDWRAGFDGLARSYESHYLLMSGSGVERYVYHVAVDDANGLLEYAETTESIVAVEDTPFKSLKDVHVLAGARTTVVRELRKLDGIAMVFTLPLICH